MAQAMSVFTIHVTLENLEGTHRIEVDAVLDTGAHYSKIPSTLAAGLHLVAERRISVRLGDNRVVERDIAPAWLYCAGHRMVVPVAIGGELEAPLLGATALEILGLAADPYNETLIPAEIFELSQATV
jgi:predicted aspartyl protease